MLRLVLSLYLTGLFLAAQAQQTTVQLDLAELSRQLEAATQPLGATTGELVPAEPTTLDLPWFDAETVTVTVVEASQFAPALQARYPEIRSYRITGGTGAVAGGRLGVSPEGATALLYGVGGELIGLQPADSTTGSGDRPHTLQRLGGSVLDFSCGVADGRGGGLEELAETQVALVENSCFQIGSELRTFRIALTNTGEFARFNGGTIASVNAAFNARLGELNAIYEREAAITFQLIAGNDVLVQLDPATDSYPQPDDAGQGANQTGDFIDGKLGSGEFDIGHGLHEKDGGSISGRAGVGNVCRGNKAGGYSTLYYQAPLLIFQHEVGHQFGCGHTVFGCGNRGSQRYEPGGGVTIMNTGAGCTGADAVGPEIGNFFHVGSLVAINAHLENNACATTPASGNQPPTSDANPGDATYVIPANTPFRLVGAGSDPNDPAGQLTYSWEDYNTDENTTLPPAETANSTVAPLFRSFAPTPSPERYFPRLSSVVNGRTDASAGETLPAVTRNLNFRLTVRDNHPGAGGTACDQLTLRVEDTGDPFEITSQNTATSLEANGARTARVTWAVAGTNTGDINTPDVDILLSTDGGQSFPYVLAEATPNDGQHDFVIPAYETTRGRIQVRGSGNVFLDINNAPITITSTSDCAARGVRIAPGEAVVAEAGSAALALRLEPAYGAELTSPISIQLDGNDASGESVLRGGEGSCVTRNYGGYQESLTVYAGSSVLTRFQGGDTGGSDGFIPHVSLFDTPYRGDCTGFVNSTRSVSGNTLNGSTFDESLGTDLAYTLVAYGNNSNATGEVTLSYSGTTLYDGVPPPGAGFAYTFGVERVSDGNLVAFEPDADLSDDSQFGTGEYRVFGLSYEGGADLQQYVGGLRQNLTDAIALQQLCAATSTNEVDVSIEGGLPVELVAFGGQSVPGANELHWSTASEVGTDRFVVERATAATWRAVGEVAAANRPHDYTFADAPAPAGTHYYRLAIHDFDGALEYSEAIALTQTEVGGQFKLFPNPVAAGPLQVQVPGELRGDLDVRLLDATGRLLRSYERRVEGGEILDLALATNPGVYRLEIRAQGERVFVGTVTQL